MGYNVICSRQEFIVLPYCCRDFMYEFQALHPGKLSNLFVYFMLCISISMFLSASVCISTVYLSVCI